jgi:hypothetical protein
MTEAASTDHGALDLRQRDDVVASGGAENHLAAVRMRSHWARIVGQQLEPEDLPVEARRALDIRYVEIDV